MLYCFIFTVMYIILLHARERLMVSIIFDKMCKFCNFSLNRLGCEVDIIDFFGSPKLILFHHLHTLPLMKE